MQHISGSISDGTSILRNKNGVVCRGFESPKVSRVAISGRLLEAIPACPMISSRCRGYVGALFVSLDKARTVRQRQFTT